MIGKNICKIRKKKGLTITELANRAGIAKSYVSNIERDVNKNPSINVIEKIASVLEVDLKTLIDPESANETKLPQLDAEWIDLVNELKESGIKKEEIKEFKTLLEFIKWQNKQ
ncbi:helix-turn-helix domain-containing protein [Lederbergia lenta]|uniref:Transcriptional regulator n=1 Tax=Lederbergia lenta TaxID=1467 RepID=A0A2X4W190_LEDLE|nr:helix-turn-helix domain-containing protein [Lederbergia lenta]MEC2325066.1 helix-turn-helix domain-containing protein [Lederbergia lenta]SQI56439.1 transcriptional regulator [Lederbergia lenta]